MEQIQPARRGGGIYDDADHWSTKSLTSVTSLRYEASFPYRKDFVNDPKGRTVHHTGTYSEEGAFIPQVPLTGFLTSAVPAVPALAAPRRDYLGPSEYHIGLYLFPIVFCSAHRHGKSDMLARTVCLPPPGFVIPNGPLV